jgi:hypothetical protein
MPLVFVHGVNVRQGALYDKELAFRNRHFSEVLYRQLGRDISIDSILSPYWGDLGASLSPDAPFLPRGDYKMLWRRVSGERESAPTEFDIQSQSETPLLQIARMDSLPALVDLLCDSLGEEAQEEQPQSEQIHIDISAQAERLFEFSHSEEGEQWLKHVNSDEELLEKLSSFFDTKAQKAGSKSSIKGIAQSIKTTGRRLHDRLSGARQGFKAKSNSLKSKLREDISNARMKLRQTTVATTAHLFNEPLRAIFHQQCALLIGDAFAYFSSRGDERVAAPIAERVMQSLREAVEIKKATGDEVIAIGHSMGGVILCDIVTCYGKDIPIDILVTVGSQFPLFADLRMFPGLREWQRPIPRPSSVKHWINIFDPHDFLGYPASHLFDGIDDFHLPTYALGSSTHTNYFNRRSFYFQLARRLTDYLP